MCWFADWVALLSARCKYKYIWVSMVHPQVKNALAKTVHVTDCTIFSLTGLIQWYVTELYRTAVFAFHVCGQSVEFITRVSDRPCGVLRCAVRWLCGVSRCDAGSLGKYVKLPTFRKVVLSSSCCMLRLQNWK